MSYSAVGTRSPRLTDSHLSPASAPVASELSRADPNGLEPYSLGTVDGTGTPYASTSYGVQPPYAVSGNGGGFGAGPATGSFTPQGEEAGEFAFSTTLRRATLPSDDPYGISIPSHASSAYPPSSTSSARPPYTSSSTSPSAIFTHLSILRLQEHFQLQSITSGLLSAAVPAARARAGGPNEFNVKASDPPWRKFLEQFKEPLIMLLLGSAAVSLVIGETDDAISIALAVVVVITVGFVQEQRSEKSLEALNKLVPHYCHLIRDSVTTTILANELVPGDLVTFSTGDRVPADIRIIQAVGLEIDESTLTGEMKPRRKVTDVVQPEMSESEEQQALSGLRDEKAKTSINERENIAFMGTLVRAGYGRGIVVATGSSTEFGMIFAMVDEVAERRTPLQMNMDELAKKLSMASFAVIGVICLLGLVQKRPALEMFTIGVSLAVAAIPEGLPIVVTVTLALGVLRMSKRKAIVKKLPSVETLGSVSVICSDKTGTLTSSEMTVVRAFTLEDGPIDLSTPRTVPHHPSRSLSRSILIGNLCNNSHRNEMGTNVGQATDVALVNILRVFGLDDRRPYFKRSVEIPFSSDSKYMAVAGVLSTGGSTTERETTHVKGAIEAVLPRCTTFSSADGKSLPLDDSKRAEVTKAAEELAGKGFRVLSFAQGSSVLGHASTTLPDGRNAALSFCGLLALQDPPRPGVAEAIAQLNAGGVQVVMITGDAERTALAIAQQLGIVRSSTSTSGAVMTGSQLDNLSQKQLQERVRNVSVFARTTPRHKMAIISAFQANGAVVAMTGDGVNDAPALKMADIGISMGKGATDVAKEAADVILVDDNFATILPAVEEGKGIFFNIQNFLSFQLSTAVAALTLITLSTAFHLKLPLNAMQILFINILMDGPPSQSLGVDPVDPRVMRRPPRAKNAPIITTQLLYRVFFSASIIVFGTLYIYVHNLNDGQADRRDQTMTFTCFVFLDLTSAIQNRGLATPLDGNRMLCLTVGASLCAQLLLVYFAPLQGIFQTASLSFIDLLHLVGLAGVSFALHEGRRRYETRMMDEGTDSWEGTVA